MRPDGVTGLRDGRLAVLRLAGPGDVAAIARLFAGLSPVSFRSRFHAGSVAPALLAELAAIDAPGAACVVAEDPALGDLAGEARYVPIGAGAAEFAVTVADSYQGAGLGGLLLDALAGHAAGHGIGRLRAVASRSNTAMLRLVAHYGWAEVGTGDLLSAVTCDISVTRGMPTWPPGASRRVLVEQRGWLGDKGPVWLHNAGSEVRRCQGPSQRTGRACQLLATGHCALAEGADEIVCLLPESDGQCAAVAAAHRLLWPDRLAT